MSQSNYIGPIDTYIETFLFEKRFGSNVFLN